jgi:hypothetical protein
MIRQLRVTALTTLLLCAPALAREDAIYRYTGNPYDSVVGGYTTDNGPIDQIDQATDFSDGNSLASNTNAPGSWTLVPEPSLRALGALALTLLAATQALRGVSDPRAARGRSTGAR